MSVLHKTVILVLTVTSIAAPAAAQTRIADIRQGTNISLALAPDGQTLLVDLLGGLWRLPARGGGATQLVAAGQNVRNPRFSPDGQQVVYQRYLDGQWDLWLLRLGANAQRHLTDTPYDEREPDFSHDGRSVIFASNSSGRFNLWSVELDSGALKQLSNEPGDSSFPTVSGHGDIAYINRSGSSWTLRQLNGRQVGDELLRSDKTLSAPSWRPGGRVILFNERDGTSSSTLKMLLLGNEPVVKQLTSDEDVFPGRAVWNSAAEYSYAADGQIWRRGIAQLNRYPIHLFAAVSLDAMRPTPVIDPIDSPGPHPVMGVADLAVSADGRRTVFTALGDIWLTERRRVRQLTDDVYVDIDPSFTPDGETIVFASDRAGDMDIWSLEVKTGTPRQLTHRSAKGYGPVVDPSGTRLAYLETEGFGPWDPSVLKVTNLDGSGKTETIAGELYKASNLAWKTSAARIELVLNAAAVGQARDTQLLVFPVSPGIPAGSRTDTDNLTLERSIPNDPVLSWSSLEAPQSYVIQVGRLFDGIRNDYLRHVDMHIEGQRIVAITARASGPLPPLVIDARDATIIPGLIDVHAHQSALLGERLGRSWLAHGVTTVRELAADLPEAIERAESWASGRRVGPRLVITPDQRIVNQGVPLGRSIPIIIRSYRHLPEGLGHGLLRQTQLFGLPVIAALERLVSIGRFNHPSNNRSLQLSSLNLSYQDSLGVLIESGTFVSTSLGALSGPAMHAMPNDSRIPIDTIERLYSASELRRWSLGQRSAVAYRRLQESLVRLVRSGGHLVTGTDSPAVPYGYGLHLELQLLADSGIPNDHVLRIATAEGALALGLDGQLGTLEAGKLADFVVLTGNPLQRIADTQSITAVVKAGVWMDQSELLNRR